MERHTLIERIQKWQKDPVLQELTCYNDSSHNLLEASIQEEEVILICPTCNDTQPIPDFLLGEDFDTMYKAREEFQNRRKKK